MDVELDPAYLTAAIQGNNKNEGEEKKKDNNIAVYQATIRRFAIHLRISDVDDSGEGAASTARKATSAFLQSMFGSSNADSDGDNDAAGMALMVHVELEGLDVILGPGRNSQEEEMEWSSELHQNNQQNQQQQHTIAPCTPSQEQQDAPGFFASMVDSAMKSLRLSIDVLDVNIRAYSEYCNNVNGLNDSAVLRSGNDELLTEEPSSSSCWVCLHLDSAKYYDLMDTQKNGDGPHSSDESSDNRGRIESGTREKMVMSKSFDWEGAVIDSASSNTRGDASYRIGSRFSMFQSHGGGQVRFRVYEKWSTGEKAAFLSARQDVNISLGRRMSVQVDLCSLTRVIKVANAMKRSEDDGDFVDAYDDDNCKAWEETSDIVQPDAGGQNMPLQQTLADEFSRETYDQIMKQYTEARHLARTQELRGGLLIPSFEERDDKHDYTGEDISFDAFFDANDHSVSYYCSMVDESNQIGNEAKGPASHSAMRETKIELGLEEFTVKVLIDGNMFTTSVSDDLGQQYVLVSMGDLRFMKFGSAGESKVNCSVSHFDIESQLNDGVSHIVNEPLLRFVDESEGEGSELLISRGPCISMMAEISEEDGVQSHRVDLVLQPIEIMYQDRALRCLSNLIAQLPQFELLALHKEEVPSTNPSSRYLSVSSKTILLMIPSQQKHNYILKSAKPNPLFQRHGYTDQGAGASKFSGIGIELDDIKIDLSKKSSYVDSVQTSSDESKAVMTCSSMLLFAKATEVERGRRNRRSYISRRADLIAFTGDEDSQSDAYLMFSFTTTAPNTSHSPEPKRGKSAFPIILPLSSTKARQEIDESDESDDEIDHLYEDAVKSKGFGPSSIQSSDPQYIMSSEASEAAKEVVVNIPNIFFDLTPAERHQLSDLLSSLRMNDNGSDNSNGNSPEANLSHDSKGKDLLSLAVNVGQLSAILHESQSDESNSYSIIMDKMQVHALAGSSGVRNVRFLSHDVTLYELANFVSIPGVCLEHHTSSIDRCRRIHGRLMKNPSTLARAIFFRQKLCQSLSPETPAVLVDVLLRGDDDCGEMSIHLNVYEMTYRYIMDSEWIKNLTTLLKPETKEGEEKHECADDASVDTSSSLTNMFVSLNDCSIDYTPPQTFNKASRIILGVGDIRVTSNIVTPSAAVQAFKISFSDLKLNICNYRHSYSEENSLLSCAHRHLNKDDIFVPDKVKCLSGHVAGLDDALCRMNFVNIVVLDNLDAILFKSNFSRHANQQDPNTTVALALGKLTIYACHDSFTCLTQTYNEWFIKTSVLSEEELEKLRELSETESDVGSFDENEEEASLDQHSTSAFHCQPAANTATAVSVTEKPRANASNTTPSAPIQEQLQRDDIVSSDLTKSLLFQNYYTFDAKNKTLAVDQHQFKHAPVIKREEVDSDDEWAAVEHDYQQYSKLPREKDQTAEWLLCDKKTDSSRGTSVQSNQPRTVKVFPQHVPVKPILDPFAGGNVDTAKLAGTNASPDIGTRVIVKDGSITFRFFDGFDWVNDAPQFHQLKRERPKDRKKALLSSLIDGDDDDSNNALDVVPLPEDRNKSLRRDLARKKLRRNPQKYFQVSIGGLKVTNDSFADSKEHRLASSLDISMSDFFVAETVSNGEPVKMMGEWVNEADHPRDNSDGIIMLKMVTRHPKLRVSSDGKLMSDESRAMLELLPLRCYFNQHTIRFIRSFFAGHPIDTREDDTEEDTYEDDIVPDDDIIDIFFESFKVRPCKLKVDYQPEDMDVDSLRYGNYTEILNLCPLEEMILSLAQVEMNDLTGWGSVFGELVGHWMEDVCATQSHKFLTRAFPFQLFSYLGDPLADLAMVLIVPEGNGATDYVKGVVGGTTTFAGKVALEAISASAKLTKFAANQLNQKALPSAGLKSSLPRRPRSVPRHAGDTAGHAYESLSSGLREANYKIITVPLREYQNGGGAGGAARSALRGIPIGVFAPIAGASEALSYTLLGLRNQLRPDIRKEEEANLRGLNNDLL